jgi:TolA-binding protein
MNNQTLMESLPIPETYEQAIELLRYSRQNVAYLKDDLATAHATLEAMQNQLAVQDSVIEKQDAVMDELRQQIDLLNENAESRSRLVESQNQIIEALTVELAAAKVVISKKLEEWQTKSVQPLAELEAENARLQEALRHVVNNAPKQRPTTLTRDCLPQAYLFWEMGQLAVKALQGVE